MRVAIVIEFGPNERHGAGAQLLKVYVDGGVDFDHFHRRRGTHGGSDHPSYTPLNGPLEWPFARGGRLGERLVFGAGPCRYWRDAVNAGRVRRAVARAGPLDVAHVVVGYDTCASYANVVPGTPGVPYVVHVWDIYHLEGLDPTAMPDMARLVGGASAVIGLTDTIRDELAQFAGIPPRPLLIGRGRVRDPDRSRAASDAALSFAHARLDIDQIRRELMNLLADAVAGPAAVGVC